MLIEKRHVFVTSEDLCSLSKIIDIPNFTNFNEWCIDLYLNLHHYLKTNFEHKWITEIVYKLKCDIINNHTYDIFVSPNYNKHTELLSFHVWDDHRHFFDNELNPLGRYDDINEYYQKEFKPEFGIFDLVKFTDPYSAANGMTCLIIGMSTEQDEFLYHLITVYGNTKVTGYANPKHVERI